MLHRFDLGEAVARLFVFDIRVVGHVRFEAPVGAVGRAEPDGEEERGAARVDFLEVCDGCVHTNLRAFAHVNLRVGAVAYQGRVHLEEVVVGQVFLEAAGARVDR